MDRTLDELEAEVASVVEEEPVEEKPSEGGDWLSKSMLAFQKALDEELLEAIRRKQLPFP
jgi:hypothetical protein